MKKIVLLFSVAAVFALVSIAQAAGSMPEIKYDDRIKECGCPPCCPKDVRAGSLPQIDVDKRIEDYEVKIKEQKIVNDVFNYVSKCKNVTKFSVEEATLNEIFVEKVGESFEK